MKEEQQKKYYTYIAQCSDGTYYTGYTTDIEKRIAVHNAGTGAKYTKTRRPVHLVYLEESDSKSLAMQREAAIKKLTRKQKEGLIMSRKTGEK